MAERLEEVADDGPEGDREEVRSEGEEEDEEGTPGVVDLTCSDEDDEEKKEDRIQLVEMKNRILLLFFFITYKFCLPALQRGWPVTHRQEVMWRGELWHRNPRTHRRPAGSWMENVSDLEPMK